MERQKTEPIFSSEEFIDYMDNSSFTSKLNNDDIVTILQDDPIIDIVEESITDPIICKSEFLPWNNIDEDVILPVLDQKYVKVFNIDGAITGNPPNSLLEDDSSNNSFDMIETCGGEKIPSLGFESWSGHLNFNINFKPMMFISNPKWCYSKEFNKLYTLRGSPLPVEVSVDSWEDAIINITPVFLKSEDISQTVMRCHNHRIADEARGSKNAMHIIESENSDATHKKTGDRYSVEIPLGVPAPGEDSKSIFIKSGCWNTCVGPSRRNYCIIFTLFSRSGLEIGRQVVNFKSCTNPRRDMGIDIKKNSKVLQGKRRMKDSASKDIRKKRKNDTTNAIAGPAEYESLMVCSEIVPQVKKYINCLMAELFVKNNKHFTPPHPDI